MSELSEAIFAVLVDLPKAEARCRRKLKRRGCKLVRQGATYLAVSRTTENVEFGPADIDAMEAWAGAR